MSNELATSIWAIVNALVSVILEVVPGLKNKWSNLQYKPLILLAFALVVPVVLWVLHCYAYIQFLEIECTWQGLFNMLIAGFTAFLVNQTAFAVATRELPNAKERA